MLSLFRMLFFLTKEERELLKKYKKLKTLEVNSRGGMRIDPFKEGS